MLEVKYADLQHSRDVNTLECTSVSRGGGRVSLYLIDRWWVRQLSVECGLISSQKKKRGGTLWQTDCTYWAIRVRLISWLSFHWTVISPGSPLWKPFKCELIDVIVPKMTELLWYYRTHLAFPLWVNSELNGNWQNVAIQTEETVVRESDERQQEGKKKVE